MKQKTILLELLRWLCAGLAVVFLVVSFRQEPVSSAAFEDVASAVTASVDLSALQEGSVQMVKRLYGLNPAQAARYVAAGGCPRRRGGPARNAEDQLRRLRPGAV